MKLYQLCFGGFALVAAVVVVSLATDGVTYWTGVHVLAAVVMFWAGLKDYRAAQ